MSEIEERLEEAPEEEKKEVLPTADEESLVAEAVAESEEIQVEEAPLYDVTKPELLELMTVASDILEKASLGLMSVDEAKKMYTKHVLEAMKKLVGEGVIIKKKARRAKAKTKVVRAKKAEKAKKTAKKGKKAGGKKAKKTTRESGTSEG